MFGKKIIETERLVLRPLAEADVDDLYAIGSDEQTAYWAGMDKYGNKEDAMDEILYLEGYGITVKGEDKVIGIVCVNDFADRWNSWTASLGYFLSRECRGQGYMPEAVSAICSVMFESEGARRVMLKIRKDNIPSRAVARKCGFIQNAQQTRWRLNLYGKPLDEFILEKECPQCA